MSKVGRPLKYETPEDMQKAIDAYFAEEGVPTVTGLAISLGFSGRSSLYYWKKYAGFKAVVDAAIEMCPFRRVNKFAGMFEYKNGWTQKEYIKQRRKVDPQFHLRMNVASLVRTRIKNGKQGKSTFDVLEYTVDELKDHIESQFTEGMSWDNYGKWHIDHIVPDKAFTYNCVEDDGFKQCWALNNLRPLWAIDNLRKGSFYEDRATA